MDDFALTPAERALFDALNARGVPFILIGWQPSNQKIELKGEILDDLFERLSYWQTSQIVPPEHLRRLDE